MAITGASGFIGTALAVECEQRGHRVRRVVRNLPAGATSDIVAIGEIGPSTDWTAALRGAETVIHLAGIAHVPDRDAPSVGSHYADVNTLGSLQLARAAAAAGVRRMVFVSSSKVYGAPIPNTAWHESSTPQPVDAYGVSKWRAEQGLRELRASSRLELVIVRPPLVFGAGARANFARLVEWSARGIPLPLGAIRNRRSLIALANLCDVLIACAGDPRAAGQTFNVADAETVSTQELLRRLARALGVPARIVSVPLPLLRAAAGLAGRTADLDRLTEDHALDCSHIRNTLGWRPIQTLDEGLAAVASAYRRRSI